jgi:nucleoside-diphosphate-sugar epimerase
MKVLVTGATGFVGSELTRHLLVVHGWSVRGTVRSTTAVLAPGIEMVCVGEISPSTDWSAALSDIDAVVHLAARVHVMRETSRDPLEQFRRVNVQGTLNLARQASKAGVRRLIYLSSIKVNGEQTRTGQPFRSQDPPDPRDAYGLSKLEAERGLLEMSASCALQTVVIRPPLIYGPGVKANFQAMMRWVHRDVPLPLGGVTDNRRSLLALENLTSLIATCLQHPAAGNRILLASDGEDLSTAELLMRLGTALGHRAKLLAVPPALLMAGGRLVGRQDLVRRLLGSLQVDIGETRKVLGWEPPTTFDRAVARTATDFLDKLRS